VIRVSDTEAVGDFGSLLEEVCLGAEVVIEDDGWPGGVARAVEPARRTISESIALA
jgi:hypothetical protein